MSAILSRPQCVNPLWPSGTIWYHRGDHRFAPSQWETALLCNDVSHWLGASLESALYHKIQSSLAKVMVCCVLGSKPLPEPMLIYCQFNPSKQNSLKFESNTRILTQENALKMLSAKWWPFCVSFHVSISPMPTKKKEKQICFHATRNCGFKLVPKSVKQKYSVNICAVSAVQCKTTKTTQSAKCSTASWISVVFCGRKAI